MTLGFTPTKSGLPRNTFSHEQLLNVCYYYRNLLAHLDAVQGKINGAIDQFLLTNPGKPSAALTAFLTTLSQIDASIQQPLLREMMEVELMLQKWEGKSAKLRSEARRQARLRAERRSGTRELGVPQALLDIDAGAPPSATPDFGDLGDPADASALSPTMRLALRGMSARPDERTPAEQVAPDTSGYKRSGLV